VPKAQPGRSISTAEIDKPTMAAPKAKAFQGSSEYESLRLITATTI
jgi:hypothetical protein